MPTPKQNASEDSPPLPTSTCSANPPLQQSNPSTPKTSQWLQPLPITLDRTTWTYCLDSGHRFPVSVTGLIGKVTKTPEDIARIMETKHIWGPRGTTIHHFLEQYVHHRFNPESTWKTPPNPISEVFRPYADFCRHLLNTPLWDRLEVVGAEVMAYCLKRNGAGTADLVVRFSDGTYGIADLKTQSKPTSQRYDIRPQLGAGVHMIGDRYKLYFTRCLALWLNPEGLIVKSHSADECLQAWLDTCDAYAARFRPF